jgi:hypothetical protein
VRAYGIAFWCALLLGLPIEGQPADRAGPQSGPWLVEIRLSHPGIAISLEFEGRTLRLHWDGPMEADAFQVAVDDAPFFRRPIIERGVTGRTLAIGWLESGLAPGVPYFIRVRPGSMQASFRIRHPGWKDSLPNPDYLRKAWEVAGRGWLQRYSGIKWNEGRKNWELDLQWPPGESRVGPLAYYLEHATRGAVNLALVDHDLKLMDELANFYLIYLKRFTTLGELRQKKSSLISTELLQNQGPDSTRTLPWVEQISSVRTRARECTLCNSQFFHPPARLIRGISTLSEAERTPVMKQFVGSYVSIIVRDHLLRLAYETHWDYWGAKELPRELIHIWKAIIRPVARPKLTYQHAMLDRDLWLIASAAEMLGANANDPTLVPLSPGEAGRLREIVQVGAELFQTKRTLYRDTRDFQGKVVESASYFNGEFDDHPEMAYARNGGRSFPAGAQKQPGQQTSWDISHFYRVPVFLRALYDNRKATNVGFPQAHDLELVINQYMYKVFHGDFNRPLFRNFFDGHDGWYRVGYHGPDFGYPPSKDCDNRKGSQRPCLTEGALFGWGLVAYFHGDLMRLQEALMRLALSTDPEIVQFRERYYEHNGQPFAFTDARGTVQYPFLLFAVLSGIAE